MTATTAPAKTDKPTGTAPAGVARRPGGPPKRRRTKSRFGTQMEEKQNLKGIYGIREEQLKHYYREALRSSGQTGSTLVSLLERRLDNAVYRAGFAETRPQARQMATHRLFEVNDRPVDVPSFRLKVGDRVTVKEGKRSKALFANFSKRLQNVAAPSWLTLEPDKYAFIVKAEPTDEEATIGVNVQAIVEFFAR